MTSIRFYHGTTAAFAQSILENGFSDIKNKTPTWSCSNMSMTYMWKFDAERYDEDMTEDDLPEPDEDVAYADGFYRAFEGALTTAAMQGVFDRDIVVFGFDIPTHLIGDGEYVEDDGSCEGMDGAFQIYSEDLDHMLRDGTIKLHVYRFRNAYKPFMRWFYLTSIKEDYMCLSDEDIEDFEFFRKHIDGESAYEALFSDPVWNYEEEEWDMTDNYKDAV